MLHSLRCSLRSARLFSSSIIQHEKLEGDHILRGCCAREHLEVFSIRADDLVREAQRRHSASPTAAAVLGRLMMGTLLMNSVIPEARTVKISLIGTGPVGYASAVSTDRTFAKAMVQFPQCELPDCEPPLRNSKMISMVTALGMCEVHLSFDFPQSNKKSKLYKFNIGPSREIAEVLAFFMREEEKIDTLAAFGVTFNKQGAVETARGFMVQVYPFSDKASCKQLLKNISSLPSLQSKADMDGRDLIYRLLRDIPLGEIDKPIVPQFGPCNHEALVSQMEEALVANPGLPEVVAGKDYLDVSCVYTTEKVRLERSVLDSALKKAESFDKVRLFKAPEEKWLDFKSNYVREEQLLRNLDEVPSKPAKPKYDPVVAGAATRPSKSKYGDYVSILNRLPPFSPLPPSPKRQLPKRKVLRRP